MISLIRTELSKSIKNKFYFIAIALAFVIQLVSVVSNYEYAQKAYEFAEKNSEYIGENWKGFIDGVSVYVLWIGEEGYTMGFTMAKYMLPILAVLPYGWSFFSEMNSGYQNNMLCRTGKTKYFIAKYLAAFISGGSVLFFMHIINIMCNALFGRLRAPSCFSLSTDIRPGVLASSLYYTKPFLYVLLWAGIAFLWAGAFAGLTMLFSQILKKNIFVLVAPFFIVILFDNVTTMILQESDYSFMNNFFVSGSIRSSVTIFMEILLLIAVGFGIGLISYRHREAL